MPEVRELAKRVKAYRKYLHKSQFELADEIGISLDELSLIEREKANPSLETLQKISAHMGITVSELVKVEEWEMQERAEKLLQRLGVTANYTGFRYTACAVALCVEQPDRLLLVTKWVYPDVAKKYGTSWRAVERNIRTVSGIIWRRGRPLLEELANRRLEKKPSNAQLLAILSSSLVVQTPDESAADGEDEAARKT